MLPNDLNERIEESNNEQNNTNLNNVRIPTFKKKKITAKTIVATKRVIRKLLIGLTNKILEAKRQNRQNMRVKKIWI